MKSRYFYPVDTPLTEALKVKPMIGRLEGVFEMVDLEGQGFDSLPVISASIVGWTAARNERQRPNLPVTYTITGMQAHEAFREILVGRLGNSDTLMRFEVDNEADAPTIIQIDWAVIDGTMLTFK